jgi:hypothetical protein
MNNEACLFVHIPKCGGTTFYRILVRQYPAQSMYAIDNIGPNIQESMKKFSKLPEQKRQQIKCIYGHMPFGIHNHLPAAFSYITFLREPVQRVVSHYNYVKVKKDHYLRKRILEENISLTDYVSQHITSEVRNGMTRQLSGVPEVDPIFGKKNVTENVYAKAIENIEHYFAVCGTLEKFEESLLLMALHYGWKHIYYQRKNINTSDKTDMPDHKTLDIIKECNQYDIKLYDYVNEKLIKKFVSRLILTTSCKREGLKTAYII